MDEIEQRLNSILSDPASMSKIMELAQGLGLNSPAPAAAPEASAAPAAPPPVPAGPPAGGLSALAPLLSSLGKQSGDDRQTALLKALRPYLRSERQERLDQAIQAARMVKIAKQAMRQFQL